MSDQTPASETVRGYGSGDVSTVISVEDVVRQAQAISDERPSVEALDALVEGEPFVSIQSLRAGYGKMEILHDFDLRVGKVSRCA